MPRKPFRIILAMGITQWPADAIAGHLGALKREFGSTIGNVNSGEGRSVRNRACGVRIRTHTTNGGGAAGSVRIRTPPERIRTGGVCGFARHPSVSAGVRNGKPPLTTLPAQPTLRA
jgi:hypothetical protein